MSDQPITAPNADPPAPTPAPAGLEQGTYEILRARLTAHGADLRGRIEQLNRARQEVFGAIPTALVATERITTQNNCVPRDLVSVGRNRFLFGYNVQFGLRTEIQIADVFALYEHREHTFTALALDPLADPQFVADFRSLHRYYKHTVFTKFQRHGPHLFMVFQTGKAPTDVKTFKWAIEDERFVYLGNRFDHEFRYPPAQEVEWIRTHRELHRHGLHPHISIEDRVFVECTGGDLTVKVEDNTASGEGIYAEPVEQPDQTLDDAEIFYALVGSLILLRIRPYREERARYLVFNEKVKEVRRVDALADSCVLLPDEHGIVFPCGYYLQSGEFKQFETGVAGLVFHQRIASPNGEDHLYTFHHRESGEYLLLSYNVIARTVAPPLVCGGFSLFDNGEMAVFRTSPEPQKHHTLQIWQTPYVGLSWQPEVRPDSFLFRLGNPELVRCLAEAQEVLTLLAKDDTFAGLYLDLVRRTTDIVDTYFWLGRPEAFALAEPLQEIRAAADRALTEFDKVVRLRREAVNALAQGRRRTEELIRDIARERFENLGQCVQRLARLRTLRGELISLRDVRYLDLDALGRLETEIVEETERLSARAVAFLLGPDSLEPLRLQAESLRAAVPQLPTVAAAGNLEADTNRAAGELDLLIETVTALKIRDATDSTRIIEGISLIYAVINQTRAALRQRVRELRGVEATAEFASQSRLLDQALANYLELAATPEACDEFLNRLLVQLEELEARFTDFDEYVVQLAEKRGAITGAFESRKLELVEARGRRAGTLLAAAERLLKGVVHRASRMTGLDELHGFFAGDAMVGKVRDLIRQLLELGDSVKADDVATQLKTAQETAVRDFKDRQELFAGGHDTLQLGRHRFRVNTQELALTIVPRGDDLCLHVAGTSYFEVLSDPELLETWAVWGLETATETPELYRGEYLAHRVLRELEAQGRIPAAREWTADERLARVREYLSPRFSDGYVKGVHDLDGALILGALIELHATLGLRRFSATARTCAAMAWAQFPEGAPKELWRGRLRGQGTVERLFPGQRPHPACREELRGLVAAFVERTRLFPSDAVDEAAGYLEEQLRVEGRFVAGPDAADLAIDFERHLPGRRAVDAFRSAREAVASDPSTGYALVRDWIRAHASSLERPVEEGILDEAAWLVFQGSVLTGGMVGGSSMVELQGLVGSHPRIRQGGLRLDFVEFRRRLRVHDTEVVPRFERCQARKRQLIEAATATLRLEEFKPRVLTSFVRNRLIDAVYLPLVGDNLAKQIGVAGDTKRTDRMGLLLLLSPPGYGKTTLMEYLASRLGIVFVKVNGPAIGHRVTSLDPAEAPNAAARDELQKLNLAFALGDNLMLCLDDIQHLNPEFLQKFISLCDAQRRIEGVYQGRSRTYDLRGKKVVVVMAGNPYTESGQRFQIPDMLANRADTYNLGDVLGRHADEFRSSYLENAAGSNPTLGRVIARHPRDLHPIVELARHGSREGLEFAGTYAPEELADAVSVTRLLLRLRDVVLRVNEEYIRSAGQADAYRTEPPFRLQGSYRNMNRLAEQVSPVMNDAELETLLQSHYRNEAQTLTRDAEANLLKFRELTGTLTPEETRRWEEIRKTFRKNLILGSSDDQDPVGRVVGHLSAFHEGLEGIREVLAGGLQGRPAPPPPIPSATLIMVTPSAASGPPLGAPAPMDLPSLAAPPGGEGIREVRITAETLQKIWQVIEAQPTPPASDGPSIPAPSTIRMPDTPG